jgi:hypothetical protein
MIKYINYKTVLSKHKKKNWRYVFNVLNELGLLKLIEDKNDEEFLIHIYKKKSRLEFFRVKRKLNALRKKYRLPSCDYIKPKQI